MMGAVPGRSSGDVVGPNRSVVDDYPDIRRAPMWQQSNVPIPPYWFLPPVTQPVYVPPVPPPPPPPPPPRTDLAVGAIVSLQSDISDSYYDPVTRQYVPVPYNAPNYAFGPTATAILSDGTFFVAVQMDSNLIFATYTTPPGSGPGGIATDAERSASAGFVRMWHLDSDLRVLGVHDQPYPPGTIVAVDGNPMPFSIAADGNQVLLLFTDPFADDGYIYVQSTNRLMDTGSAVVSVSPNPNATFVGPATKMMDYPLDYNSYARVVAPDTTTMVATDINWVSAPGDFVFRPELVITKLQLFALSWVDVPEVPINVEWKITDNSLAYGSDVLISGVNHQVETDFSAYNYYPVTQAVPGSNFYLRVDIEATDLQKTAIKAAAVAGHLRLAASVASSGERRMLTLGLGITYGTGT